MDEPGCNTIDPQTEPGLSNTHQAARDYARRGWPVLPLYSIVNARCTCGKADCGSPGKHPRTLRGLKEATSDETRIDDWWAERPDANVGILTGAASGFVVVDVDGPQGRESLDLLESEHGELPPTIEAATGGGGFHFLFAHPDGTVKNRTGVKPGIDVRGDGGYIVAPPSNHASGNHYRWEERRAPGDIELAEMPQWLHDLITRKPESPVERNGTATRSAADLLQRGQLYAAKADAASEGERNSAAFRLAGNLAALSDDFGRRLSEQEILPLVCAWNLRNNPPLDEAELQGCVASALTNGTPRAAKTERRSSDVAHAGQGQIVEGKTLSVPITYKRATSAELAGGDFSIEYLITGAMVAGQPGVAGGGKKTLKTSVIVDASISLATGGYFLGRFLVPRACRVAVMSGESGLATLQETANRVCAAAGWRLEDIGNLIWSPDLPMLGRHDHLESLEKFLTSDAIEVLFVDPTYLAMSGADAGNLFVQGELLRNVSSLCQGLGVTPWLVHHTKKTIGREFGGPPELEDIAWAGFQEFARQWWLLSRREFYVPGTGEHHLWLSIGGSAGHSSLWAADIEEGSIGDVGGRRWEVSLSSPGDARQQAEQRKADAKDRRQAEQLDSDVRAIVDAVAALPDQRGTKTDIRDATGLRSSRFNAAFAAALKQKYIVPATITKGNNREYDGYRLGDE